MKINVLCYRRLLLVCADLFLILGLAEALGVIAPVKADTYHDVNHDKVVGAFWIDIGLHLLAASALFFIAFKLKERNWNSTSVHNISGLLV